MKKVFAVCMAVSIVFFAGAAFAGTAHDNTGCGLGTMLWGNSADGSTVSQSLQATTNGSFGSQTFGITTGTSECKSPSGFVKNEKINEFVLANIDNIAKEIAMGYGETLDTLAELMGVAAPERAKFYAKLQVNFDKIFVSERVESAEVVDNIAAVYSQI